MNYIGIHAEYGEKENMKCDAIGVLQLTGYVIQSPDLTARQNHPVCGNQ